MRILKSQIATSGFLSSRKGRIEVLEVYREKSPGFLLIGKRGLFFSLAWKRIISALEIRLGLAAC
jgi:hypothetical protein